MSAKANVSQWSISGDFGGPPPSSGGRGRQHGMIDRRAAQQGPVGIVPGASPPPTNQSQARAAAGMASTRGNVGNGDIISHTPRSSSGTLQPLGGSHRDSPMAASERGGYPQMQHSPQQREPQAQQQLPPRHNNYSQRPEQHYHHERVMDGHSSVDDFDFSKYSSRHGGGPPPRNQMPPLQVPPQGQHAFPHHDGMSSTYSQSVASSVREDVYEQKRYMYLSGRRLQPPPALPNTPHGQGLPPRPVQPRQQEEQAQRQSSLGENGVQDLEPRGRNPHIEGVKSGRRRTEIWERRREEFIRRKRREQSSRPTSGDSGGQYDENRVLHGRRAGVPRSDSLKSFGSGLQEMPPTPVGQQPVNSNRVQQHAPPSAGASSARTRGTASSRGRPPGGASSIQLG
eukprot:gb/GECG01005191.1/.p1 GENE.gb/GECG01005191.1/~~gb/GECG01005191.1/.p1  ORF type:complete len:398 (+),score=54.01 gb/GECG01005191.1/:1-1194(+)